MIRFPSRLCRYSILFLVFSVAAMASPPNIVFILIDDMGWPDLGCYGNSFNETPNIDALADQGMRFTDAYAACPVCSPTRASILSGQYPARVGVTDFIPGHWRPYERLRVPINRTQYLPLEITTVAEALKTNDYATGMFGKWHLGGRDQYPDHQGFDEMLVQSGGAHFNTATIPDAGLSKDDYLSEVLTARAVKFMEDHRDERFFVYLAHYAVHIPLQAREELIAKYKAKPPPPTGVNNPVYAAMVEHVDQSVGRVLAALDDLNLAANTLVVLFSDNGGLRQRYDKGDDVIVSTNAPLRNEKGTVYEGGIRVPLIIRWPGKVSEGAVCAEPVSSVDFYPTLLAAAETEPKNGIVLDGVSLLPTLTAETPVDREAIYWHYPHYHHDVPAGAVRAGDWKLIENYEDGSVALYNLANDIGEEHDLSPAEPERTAAMREMLAKWRTDVGAEMPVPNPDYDPARAAEWGKNPGR